MCILIHVYYLSKRIHKKLLEVAASREEKGKMHARSGRALEFSLITFLYSWVFTMR